MAARFPVASLTCSELRKFTKLHRGGCWEGPGVIRCQNLVPAFPDLRLHWGFLYPRKQTEGLGMGSGAEEMNSCQQQAQIAPALCCEGAGREQGEQEGGMGSWAFQSGLMVQLASRDGRSAWLTWCISHLHLRVMNCRWCFPDREVPSSSSSSCFWCGTHTPPHTKVLATAVDAKKHNSSAKQSAGGKRLFKGCLPRLCSSSAVLGG